MLRALNAQREPWMERVRSLGRAGILLTPCVAPPPDVSNEYLKLETQYQMPGARVTCFTSTKVAILQILTPEALRAPGRSIEKELGLGGFCDAEEETVSGARFTRCTSTEELSLTQLTHPKKSARHWKGARKRAIWGVQRRRGRLA